jgi:hypothetical protein
VVPRRDLEGDLPSREWKNLIEYGLVSFSLQEPGCREDYPLTVVFISNPVSVLIWGIGAFILYLFGLLWLIGYVMYVFCWRSSCWPATVSTATITEKPVRSGKGA